MNISVKPGEIVTKSETTCVKCNDDREIITIECHRKTGFPMQVKRCFKCGERK